MPWNTLRSWLARPARSSPARPPLQFNLQPLEARLTPSFTVGNNVNITKSNAGDAEDSITADPANPMNLFASSTGSNVFKYSTDGGATWKDSDHSAIDNSAS